MIEEFSTSALIFAGKAVFTIKNKETGNHYTFKVQKPTSNLPAHVKAGMWWVSCKSHNNQWIYMLTAKWENGRGLFLRLTANSGITTMEHPAAKAFDWFIRKLNDRQLPDKLILEFSDRCCRCGRELTDVRSIQQHVGPECIKYIGMER